MSATFRTLTIVQRLILVAFVALASAAAHLSTAPAAGAASTTRTAVPSYAAVQSMTAAKAVRVAATRKGAPYVLGAQGPTKFDCSGLTRWSFARVGKWLPRTAQQQWTRAQHIRPGQRRAGDLVFFFSGKHAYHVAIYAGNGKIWHSPRPGKRVSLVPLWTNRVSYARVR